MVIKTYFDENKLFIDIKQFVFDNISEISKEGFIDKITKVAVDSIKSTLTVTTKKGQDLNVIGEEDLL